MLTRTQTLELCVEHLTVPIACYLFNRSYPAPNLAHMIILATVDAFVRRFIANLSDTVAIEISSQNGYIDEKDDQITITNPKFFYLTSSCAHLMLGLLPIF